MDSKRKANGAISVESDDRASKRRKLAGETRDSTTAYGIAFLEQLRRTADKGGRLVATNFEELPPRDGNAEYYKRTRMPISLTLIEEKLNNGDFENLAELESYFKRMITNAKEFYSRSTTAFDDAERIRKALSNYMTKKNPAYQNRHYQAVPTPLPEEDSNDPEDEDVEGEKDTEEAIEDAQDENDQEEDEGDEEDDKEEEKEEDEEEDEDEDEDDEEEEPSSKKRTITLKRRGPGRPPRRASTRGKETPKPAATPAKPDHEYEDVPYKGLSFQEAQEKIVEELLRHQEPEYDDAYFEAFINLPPRSLKDYFKVITDPVSIKKLQKMVKGIRGRGETTGTSDFKSWNAFEEKSKLLWTNAFFYNEEGSEIYALAQELEDFFRDQLKQAKAVVSEPSQPKIKLKVGQSSDTPTPSAKKITIHVGGQRDSVDSPAPAQPTDTVTNGQNVNGIARTSTPAQPPNNPQVDKARSVSVTVPSPSPSTQAPPKAEDAASASPAVVPRQLSAMSGLATPGVAAVAAPVPVPVPVVQPQPVQHNPLANGYMEQKHPRRPGKGVKDALLSSVRIQVHPSFQAHSPTVATVMPNPADMQQSATVNLPPHLTRILVIPALPDHLRNRQYSLWTLVNKQPLKPLHQQAPGQLPQERAFEAILHPGVNVVESHLIAAIPRDERVLGGPEVDLEVFTIFVNVLRN
ncbi:hypothetical protein FZEAL_3773 [Fusarium zealandicum]|uniref:Bromo domain-containing protein n=1 Tax=Fusarium zealandicum TaxID=1053134 RepID=A0A8H4XLG1_9HYPO|nr:hypothetical protein FZEAL_3773 [Fusarium zealandicum]